MFKWEYPPTPVVEREVTVIKKMKPRQMVTILTIDKHGVGRSVEYVGDSATASVNDGLLTIVTYDHPRKNVVTRVLRDWSQYRLEDHPDETYEHSYPVYKNGYGSFN